MGNQLTGRVMVILDDWRGQLNGRRRNEPEHSLKMPAQRSKRGGSGTFLGVCSDDRQYWIKPINNRQGKRVPVTEQIVGRVGTLIGAPTCDVRLIGIGSDVAGWEFRNSCFLETGIAHGSLSVEKCSEVNRLQYRSRDENMRRHTAILALYDWCWGSDPQWLVTDSSEYEYFSHDHGWYLPPPGPVWNCDEILRTVDTANEFPDEGGGLDAITVSETADKLERVTGKDLVDKLSEIPSDWPVTDEELECVGFFLERRAPHVADRLRARIGV